MDNQNNENISTDVNQEPIDMTSASVNPVKAPKKKAPIIIGSVLGVAAVGGVAAAAAIHFNPSLKDAIERNTSDPKEYFANKETEYIKENTKALSENMEKASEVYSSFDFKDFDLDNFVIPAGAYDIIGTVSFDMDKISDLVMDNIPEDTDTTGMTTAMEIAKSFKSFSLGGKFVSNGKGLISTTGKFTLNDNSVIDAQIIFDTESKSVYAALPSISGKFVKYTVPEEIIEQFKSELEKSMQQVQENSEEFTQTRDAMVNACNVIADNSDKIAEIVEDYYKIIVDGVKDDIEMDKDASLEIAGSEFSVTEMSTTIDSDDTVGIAKDVLNSAKDDENIKSIVSSLGYENEFDKAIDDVLDELKDVSSSDFEVEITAWSNKKGEIIGHKFKSDDVEFGYAVLENKDDTYSSIWLISPEDQKFSFDCVTEGEDSESGTISFKIDTDELYAVIKAEYDNYEVVDAQKGLINFDAKITADFDYEAPKAVDDAKDAQDEDDEQGVSSNKDEDITVGLEILKNTAITLSSKCTEDSSELTYGIEYSGDSILNFSIKCEKLSDTTVELPAESDTIVITDNAEDISSAMIEYLTSANIVALKDNIKNAIDNTMISTVIDQYFTKAGLDKFDGTQKAEDVTALITALAGSKNPDYDDKAYDYENYDDDDDLGLSFNDDESGESDDVDAGLSGSDNTEDDEDINKLFN